VRLVPPGWRLGLLVLLASAAIAGGASAQQASTGGAPDLTGTWTVVNTSGPGVPGTLVITNGRGGAFDGTGYGGGWIVKGTVSGNSVANAKQGINVEGAGTAGSPIRVFANTITGSSSSAQFLCGTKTCSAYNISPDSVVDRNGETAAVTTWTWHNCP